ncbi:septum formation family protein [Micromonospora echinospora]|uniref:septum formation family protein n=1 Tax=Micromonospora echinospora TaxID=1877 RepID=UPI00366FABCF
MRRWWRASALSGAVALALTGCASGPDSGGEPADEPPPSAGPAVFQPQNFTCHPFDQETVDVSTYRPVDCAEKHQAETLHVGTFTGEHARRDIPPAYGAPSWAVAHADCDRAVARELGADWRTGRLDLAVVLPTLALWQDGARWYRCDVAEVTSLDDDTVTSRTGSLKGALTGTGPLSLGCVTAPPASDDIGEMTPVACAEKHHAEFVGVYQATEDSFRSFFANEDAVHRRCLRLVADYAAVPNDSTLANRVRTVVDHPSEQEWKFGDRGVRCFLWREDPLTRSVRGGGTRALPVQFG